MIGNKTCNPLSYWLRSFVSMAFLLAFSVVLTALSPAFADAPAPSKELETITRDLLQKFRTNRERYQKNEKDFFNEVDSLLSPVVDFDYMARSVMGRHRQDATPEQVTAFAAAFKNSLIEFYGNALLKLDTVDPDIQKVEDVPAAVVKDHLSGKTRQLKVDMTVKSGNRSFVISYTMAYEAPRWKLRNIIIDGINIGTQFRSQFDEAMKKHKGKVQDVVSHWKEIMSSTDTKN